MAITFIEKRRRLKYLFPVLIVIILLTAFIWWRGFFTKEKLILSPIEVVPVKKIEINYEIFKHPLLEKVKPLEPIPLFEGIGRENPFIPY